MAGVTQTVQFDLASRTVRELNQFLHADLRRSGARHIEVAHPSGRHNIAVGVDADVDIDVKGHVGYYLGGMNKQARITVHGNAGKGVAENIMSGMVRVKGSASECAGASGHGGLLVIEGDSAGRCGISMKGCDIVVGGDVGHLSAFMAQAGRLVVCGEAGAGLGDSLYEAVIYVRGKLHGLGADAREEPMSDADRSAVADLLAKAGFKHNAGEFKRIASAKTLYHWNADHAGAYG